MSANPYLIQGPALISFSGGRTSGFMLKHILDAHGGTLPADVHVAFCNTGREMPETLDFVQECSERWNVRIVWLEFDADEEHRTRIVNHNSASRNGEPFVQVIERSRKGMLPNPVTRFCTIELKIRRKQKFMHQIMGHERWTGAVGLRADEMGRVLKQRKRNASNKEREHAVMPLAEAGVTKRDVAEWWGRQDFNLRLLNVNGSTPLGNCDLCFLKRESNLLGIIRDRPELAEWWVEQEQKAVARGAMRNPAMAQFNADWSYVSLVKRSASQIDFIADDQEESLDCACTD